MSNVEKIFTSHGWQMKMETNGNFTGRKGTLIVTKKNNKLSMWEIDNPPLRVTAELQHISKMAKTDFYNLIASLSFKTPDWEHGDMEGWAEERGYFYQRHMAQWLTFSSGMVILKGADTKVFIDGVRIFKINGNLEDYQLERVCNLCCQLAIENS